MPKLFDSSGPVTLDRYSRFYSMEHRDLIAKESKEELVAEVNRLTLETNDLIETLVYSKEGIDILINNEVLSEEALDNATHDDLQNIVDIIDRYERELGDKFASKENLKYLSNVRDVVVQFTKSLLSILYYRKDKLEKFNRVFRLVYKGLVEEIERSK